MMNYKLKGTGAVRNLPIIRGTTTRKRLKRKTMTQEEVKERLIQVMTRFMKGDETMNSITDCIQDIVYMVVEEKLNKRLEEERSYILEGKIRDIKQIAFELAKSPIWHLLIEGSTEGPLFAAQKSIDNILKTSIYFENKLAELVK